MLTNTSGLRERLQEPTFPFYFDSKSCLENPRRLKHSSAMFHLRLSWTWITVLFYAIEVGLWPLPRAEAQENACTEICPDSCAQVSLSACTGVNCTNTVAGSVTTCQAALFNDVSNVTCVDGACQNTRVQGSSTASCSGTDTCINVQVNQSKIDCLEAACESAQFHSSAVYCEDYSTCTTSLFFTCSCCDGYSTICGNQPSCQAVAFCSDLFLGRTCKEWGNPACADVSVAETGVDVLICDGGNCANAALTGSVLCDNKNNAAAIFTCQGANFTNATVVCDSGACQRSNFM